MHKSSLFGVFALVWISFTLVAWIVVVPEWLSFANLALLSTLVLALFAIPVMVQRTGQPARSIAGVLYDTEQAGHPGGPSAAR